MMNSGEVVMTFENGNDDFRMEYLLSNVRIYGNRMKTYCYEGDPELIQKWVQEKSGIKPTFSKKQQGKQYKLFLIRNFLDGYVLKMTKELLSLHYHTRVVKTKKKTFQKRYKRNKRG